MLLRLQYQHARLGDSHNRNVFLTALEARKVLAGLVSSEVSFLALQMATFSLCLYMACSLCLPPWHLSVCLNLLEMTPVRLAQGSD